MLPDETTAVVDRSTWTPQPVFGLVGSVGGVDRADLEATLNMGVGMVAVTAATDTDQVLQSLAEAGIPAWVCGEVTRGVGGTVTLVGDYA